MIARKLPPSPVVSIGCCLPSSTEALCYANGKWGTLAFKEKVVPCCWNQEVSKQQKNKTFIWRHMFSVIYVTLFPGSQLVGKLFASVCRQVNVFHANYRQHQISLCDQQATSYQLVMEYTLFPCKWITMWSATSSTIPCKSSFWYGHNLNLLICVSGHKFSQA